MHHIYYLQISIYIPKPLSKSFEDIKDEDGATLRPNRNKFGAHSEGGGETDAASPNSSRGVPPSPVRGRRLCPPPPPPPPRSNALEIFSRDFASMIPANSNRLCPSLPLPTLSAFTPPPPPSPPSAIALAAIRDLVGSSILGFIFRLTVRGERTWVCPGRRRRRS